ETRNDEQDTQNTRKETRFIYKEAEWNQPQAPKHLGDHKPLGMQIEEQEGQRIALRLVEYGQKSGTADQGKGGELVQHVQERNRDADQRQHHHQRSMSLIDSFE